MAVTFTDKAAGELRARLAALGVQRRARVDVPLGGAARSCATSRRSAVGRILPSKALALRQIANTLPGAVQVPARGRPRDRDRVGEEPPHPARALPREADGREPPIPLDLMQRVYREYERRKAGRGR